MDESQESQENGVSSGHKSAPFQGTRAPSWVESFLKEPVIKMNAKSIYYLSLVPKSQ